MLQSKPGGMKSYVAFDNFDRSVCAAVIYENIFPVVVGLLKHAFDAGFQIVLGIIKRSQNADERGSAIHTVRSSPEVIFGERFFADFACQSNCGPGSCDQLNKGQFDRRMRGEAADGSPKGVRYQIRDR